MTTQPADRITAKLPVKPAKTKKPIKTQASRAVKARRMWAQCETHEVRTERQLLCDPKREAHRGSDHAPVAVLDISDPDALVRQAGEALFSHHQLFCVPAHIRGRWGDMCEDRRQHWYDQARAVLTSLGIIPAKKGRK